MEWEAFDWQVQRARWNSPATPNTATDKLFAWDWEDAESELSFALRRSVVQATVAQGTTVTFEQERTTAKIIADLSSDQPLFTWEGVLSEGWFIENVQSSPSDSLENWEVLPQGKTCCCEHPGIMPRVLAKQLDSLFKQIANRLAFVV